MKIGNRKVRCCAQRFHNHGKSQRFHFCFFSCVWAVVLQWLNVGWGAVLRNTNTRTRFRTSLWVPERSRQHIQLARAVTAQLPPSPTEQTTARDRNKNKISSNAYYNTTYTVLHFETENYQRRKRRKKKKGENLQFRTNLHMFYRVPCTRSHKSSH